MLGRRILCLLSICALLASNESVEIPIIETIEETVQEETPVVEIPDNEVPQAEPIVEEEPTEPEVELIPEADPTLEEPQVPEEEPALEEPQVLEEEPATIEIQMVEETIYFASPAEIGWGDIDTYFKVWEKDGSFTNPCQSYVASKYHGSIPDGIWIYMPEDSFVYNGCKVTFTSAIESYTVVAGGQQQTQYYTSGHGIYVFYGNELLTEGVDFSLDFAYNQDVPQVSDEEPTIFIRGKGNYTGTIEKNFNITPKDIFGCSITALNTFNEKYDENNQLVAQYTGVVVWDYAAYTRVTLKEDKDYTISYDDSSRDAYKKVGDWKITIYGEGNYTGRTQVNEYIFASENLNKATLTIKTKTYTADNTYKQPAVTVKLGKKTLRKNIDYIVHYTNNIYPSNGAKIAIEGIGNYTGYKYGYFTIKPASMGSWKISCSLNNTEYQPSGTARGTLYVYKDGGALATYNRDYTFTVDGQQTYGSLITTPGTHTVTVAAATQTKFYGSKKTYKYTIKKYNLTTHAKYGQVYVSTGTIEHSKGGAKFVPSISVSNGGQIISIPSDQFTYSYSQNTKVGTGKVTAKANGKSYYTGQATGTFTIYQKDLIAVTASASDVVFKNSKKNFMGKLTLTDTDGKVLKSGTDYTVAGYFYTSGQPVAATDIVPVGTTLYIQATGKGSYTGTTSATFRITKASIASASARIYTIEYSKYATSIDPSDIDYVKVGREELLYGTDYIIEPGTLTQNTSKKTGTIVIRGIGNYGGTKKLTFKLDRRSF